MRARRSAGDASPPATPQHPSRAQPLLHSRQTLPALPQLSHLQNRPRTPVRLPPRGHARPHSLRPPLRSPKGPAPVRAAGGRSLPQGTPVGHLPRGPRDPAPGPGARSCGWRGVPFTRSRRRRGDTTSRGTNLSSLALSTEPRVGPPQPGAVPPSLPHSLTSGSAPVRGIPSPPCPVGPCRRPPPLTASFGRPPRRAGLGSAVRASACPCLPRLALREAAACASRA